MISKFCIHLESRAKSWEDPSSGAELLYVQGIFSLLSFAASKQTMYFPGPSEVLQTEILRDSTIKQLADHLLIGANDTRSLLSRYSLHSQVLRSVILYTDYRAIDNSSVSFVA